MNEQQNKGNGNLKGSGPVLGITLFSLTNEWQQRLYTLDGVIEKVAELGVGPAVEVVGFQSFREFPDVSDETADHFRDLLQQHGLIPSCLGGNSDIGRRKDRLMSLDESFDYIKRQIISAAKMGFPVYRYQPGAGLDVMEKLVPTAEKYEIQLACELHSPLAVDHPEVVAFREMYDRVGSPFLGFIPDFSTSMTSIPEGYWGNLRGAGGSEDLIEAVKEIWYTDKSIPEKFGALHETGAKLGAGPEAMGHLNTVMTMFGHMPVEKWSGLLPYARHVHGKFYHVNEMGHEPSIPYEQIMALLKRTDYKGTISSEWEGQAFTEEPVGFQEVQAWHRMCSRLLA